MAEQDKVKILDKLESEAIEMLDNFKQHPIKSIFIAIVILWGVKQIYKLIRS